MIVIDMDGGRFDTAYVSLLSRILDDGERARPRGMEVLELRPAALRLTGTLRDRWLTLPGRRVSHALGVLEGLQLVGGFSVPEGLVHVAPQYERFTNPATGRLDGAYGPRLRGQVDYVVRLLRQDRDSRQAVAAIYGRRDHRASNDVPCTVALQFLLRGGRLELVAFMRSNDAWLGVPYDVIQFSMLQEAVARSLGAEVGVYTHVAASMHLYTRDADRARGLVVRGDRGDPGFVGPPEMPARHHRDAALAAAAVVSGWWHGVVGGMERIRGVGPAAGYDPPNGSFDRWCLTTLSGCHDHTTRLTVGQRR